MSNSLSNISEKAGMAPGSLVHVGAVSEEESTISVIDYNKEKIEEQQIQSIEQVLEFIKKETVTWVNIEGLTNVNIIESVGNLFDIHPLVLEDILNTHQRPKFEEYDGYLYIVLKSLSLENKKFEVNYEQISILVLDKLVVTFKEKQDDLFLPLRQRLKNNKGRFRHEGSDYLTYAIIDTIVDQNFVLLDSLDEILDSLEKELFTDPTPETLTSIQKVKRELINIKRSILPLRELLAAILRSESTLIKKKIHIYFSDIYDHILSITEAIESARDMLSALLDIYLSMTSNKMNEVMKILTIFASIFIPLTFIAGIYGMNFEYMPELTWKWAYPALWGAFIAIPVILALYFRKKKWL